jgi:hypothetical protein
MASLAMNPQFWLCELSVHGNPTLIDGPHSNAAGADESLAG